MKLAAILVEIRRLATVLPPRHIDPLQAIYQRCRRCRRTVQNGRRWSAWRLRLRKAHQANSMNRMY